MTEYLFVRRDEIGTDLTALPDGITVKSVTIAPVGSARGLHATHTLPSATVTGPHISNLIEATNALKVLSDGTGSFTPPDPLRSDALRLLEVRLTAAGGANMEGFQEALVSQVLHTQANSTVPGIEYISLVTMAFANKTVPLVDNGGGFYSINANTFVGSGGSVETAIGVNVETGIFTGGAANRRHGVLLQSHGDLHAVDNDAALDVWATHGEIGWKHFATFSDAERSDAQSISSTGSMFKALAAFTIAHNADMGLVTVTGNIENWPNWQVTGSGNMTLRSTDASALPGPLIVLERNSPTPANNDAGGVITFLGKDTAGAAQFLARISSFINDVTLGAETTSLLFQTTVAGAETTRVAIKDGIQTVASGVAPTGGDMGPGTINTAGLIHTNGVVVPTISSANILSNKSIPLATNTLTGTIAEFNTAVSDANLIVGALGGTDNVALRSDGTGGLTAQGSVLVIADTTGRLSRSGNGGIAVQGTNTNDSPAAGDQGERLVNAVEVGSATSLVTNTDTVFASRSLEPGDYVINAKANFVSDPTTSVTLQQISLSLTSSRDLTAMHLSNAYNGPALVGVNMSATIPSTEFKFASTTTVNMIVRSAFTVSTEAVWGGMEIRRVR